MNKIFREIQRIPNNIKNAINFILLKINNPRVKILKKKHMKELSIHSMMSEDYLVMNTFFKSVVKGVFL